METTGANSVGSEGQRSSAIEAGPAKLSAPFVPLLETMAQASGSDKTNQSLKVDPSRSTSLASFDSSNISSPRPRDTAASSVLGRSNSLKTSHSSIRHAVDTRAYAQTSLAFNSGKSSIQQRPATSSSHPVTVDTSFRSSTARNGLSQPRVAAAVDIDEPLVSATSSSSLFTPITSPFRPEFERAEVSEPLSSPFLHHTHRQAPKETHLAEVDVDPISGRKIVNHYEIISELGRGVHGKVKLGRDLHTSNFVAIKIVDRVSKRKRLGRTGDQEAKIKREIAILKKARHPNIVGLLEVIDDPLKKKVYIVLEHAELGEVEWRTRGEPEVCYVEYRRNQRESDGIFDNEEEDRYDQHIMETAHRHLERQERRDWEESQQRLRDGRASNVGLWSLEHGGESDVDTQSPIRGRYAPNSNPLRTQETQTPPLQTPQESLTETTRGNDTMPPPPLPQSLTNNNTRPSRQPFDALSTAEVQASLLDGMEDNIFGTYESHSPREYSASAFDSFASSRNDYIADRVPEHYSFVPTMSLSEIRRAIRDTMLGLEYLHYQGVVHRDIKPANLLQTKDHRVKISDFGVSYLGKATEDLVEDPSDTEDQDFDEALELAKTVGTPAFYAPELCRLDMDEENPAPVTNQIDIWAVGVTLYCLVFGRVPFHHDNTFALMRLIAERDLYIPARRLKAVDTPREPHEMLQSPHAQTRQQPDPDKRPPHDLEYEEVSEELRDLLKRLLTKDPRKRIKLTEVKHHPWLLTDISDPIKWLDESDPTVLTQGKTIEVSQEDVDVAVVPYGISERAKNIASRVKRKVVDVLGYGKGTSRRRAKSSAAGTGRSSNASSSSTISQDGRRHEDRRQSLRPDEALLAALRASKEHDHPLARSVTASPEPPESVVDQLEEFAPTRPDALERGVSATGSIRTIRQRDVAFLSNSGAATAPALPSTPNLLERPPNTSDGILGTAHSRENSGIRGVLFKDNRDLQPHMGGFLRLSHEDTHSRPSVAISQAVAAGLVHTPSPRKEKESLISSASPSPASSRPPSIGGPHDILRPNDKHDLPSRNSSISSMSSRGRGGLSSRYHPHQPHSSSGTTEASGSSPAPRKVSHPQLDADIIARAKEEQLRRLIQEERQHQASASSAPSPVSLAPCPPSPDDIDFNQLQEELSAAQPTNATATTIHQAIPENAPLISRDSDEQFPPGMSQSTSNPSIPSALSANSSIGNEEMAIFGARSSKATAAWSNAQSQENRPHIRDLSPHFEEDPRIVGQDDYSSDDDFLEMSSKRKPQQRGIASNQPSVPVSSRGTDTSDTTPQ